MNTILERVESRETFARNLRAAMAYRQLSRGGIHRKKGLAASTVGRVLSLSHAPDLDTIEVLAKAVDFAPWQLLVASFDPQNPPLIPELTPEEKALYERFRALIHSKNNQATQSD